MPQGPTGNTGPSRPAVFRFPRSHRLTRGAQLDAVRREGKRIRTGTLEARAVASLLSHPRVGIVVPKYKHSGVERNLVKRRLRELARTRLLPALAPTPADVTLRALPAAYEADFARLLADVERLAREVASLARPTPPAPTPAPAAPLAAPPATPIDPPVA